MKYKKPKGTLDLLPEDCLKRNYIESKVREMFLIYSYKEIRTPAFENTNLFRRAIGEMTDVVSKEMYTFNNDEFTLKPEMTAPVIRAYLENNLDAIYPMNKLFYISNMFRHENPQAGRYREFSQFGAEAIGSSDYNIDVEMISLAYEILHSFSLSDISVKLNNIGTIEERKIFLNDFVEYLNKYINDLSSDSKNRLTKNPLRIFDSKNENDIDILKNAPVLYDYLFDETKIFFENVINELKKLGIKFEIDYKLVRGFDYYTSTTFEIISNELGAQNAILGGGRYDNLVEQFGGKKTPAIGFACGLERLTIVLEKTNYFFHEYPKLKLYLITIGEKAKKYSCELLSILRRAGISCDTDYLSRSVKAQMREANKIGALFTIVMGDSEIEQNIFVVKEMSTGNTNEIKKSEIVKYFVDK
jgi:histidyl-tRNA synthetase